MNGLCLTLCAAACLAGLVGYLCRDWPTASAIRLVCACVCAVSLWQAARQTVWPGITVSNNAETVYSSAFAEQVGERLVAAVLRDAGLTYRRIEVETDISGARGIEISKVRVTTTESAEAVTAAVRRQMTVGEVEIAYG